MCSTLFSFAQLAAKWRSPQEKPLITFASNDSAGATCILSSRDFLNLLDHKEMHAIKPFWSTIWTTKSCTRKDPSGARFGAQKVARENTHLEHNLEHKKLHAKTPIWSTIWSTKSCTRKDPFGARSGAQKVAREKTHLEHDLDHKKLHAKRLVWSTIRSTKSCTKKGWSRARSGPQKIARDKTHLEHGRLTWMGCGFWRVEGPSHSWFCTSSRHFRGAIFLFLLASLQLK